MIELRGERLLGASTSAGRPFCAITLAIVNVLPEPVTPSSVWKALARPPGLPPAARRLGLIPAGPTGPKSC